MNVILNRHQTEISIVVDKNHIENKTNTTLNGLSRSRVGQKSL